MTVVGILTRLARDDRPVVALLLAAATGFWATLASGTALMDPVHASFGIGSTLLLLFMWFSMMLAMMLPSAIPAFLTYRAMSRKIATDGKPATTFARFIVGYLTVWSLFCLLAVALQLTTRDLIPMTGMMAVTSGVLGAGLLIAAGAYQLTALKNACLRHCQSPLMYFARHWRDGPFRLGLAHGSHCLGCCWVLMGLLFYGGVMQPLWIVGIALYVAIEKLLPRRYPLTRYSGLVLILWGAVTFTAALV